MTIHNKIYLNIVEEAKKRFKIWPSFYASVWVTNQYKKKKLDIVRKKAKKLGIKEQIEISNRPTKKYMLSYNGKKIHFGHSNYQDYIDHQDKIRRNNYRNRSSKIRNKKGEFTYLDKGSPNYYAYHLLW